MISVLGAMVTDISAKSLTTYVACDSNPGKVHISFGGVGRNNAVNLRRLGFDVSFFTVVGKDGNSLASIDECKKLGIDDSGAIYSDFGGSYYIDINNEHGELMSAVSDMDSVKLLDTDYVKGIMNRLNNSEVLVMDTNLEESTIEYAMKNVKVPIFIDTVSTKKARKIYNILKTGSDLSFNTIKMNRIEAESVTGISIAGRKDIEKCADYLISKGVKNVCITLGADGAYLKNKDNIVFVPAVHKEIVSSSGAGDAFLSGLIYSYLHGYDIYKSAKTAANAAGVTAMSEETTSPELCPESIE